jgi:hypothetical protein
MKRAAKDLKVSDIIMPPARELHLWMRRDALSRHLSEAALYLRVIDVCEGKPDKTGRWLIVTCEYSAEWLAGRKGWPFKFKARPDTPWQIVSSIFP